MRKTKIISLLIFLLLCIVLTTSIFAYDNGEQYVYYETNGDYSNQWDIYMENDVVPFDIGIELDGRWRDGTWVPFTACFGISALSMSQFQSSFNRWNSALPYNKLWLSPDVRHHSTWDNRFDNFGNQIFRCVLPGGPIGRMQDRRRAGSYINGLPEYVEVNILLNTAHPFANEAWGCRYRYDVYTVFLHEAGHALGVGHTTRSDFRYMMNVMWPGIRPGEHRRFLGNYDLHALWWLNYQNVWWGRDVYDREVKYHEQ